MKMKTIPKTCERLSPHSDEESFLETCERMSPIFEKDVLQFMQDWALKNSKESPSALSMVMSCELLSVYIRFSMPFARSKEIFRANAFEAIDRMLERLEDFKDE
jgi:hypothetical protein